VKPHGRRRRAEAVPRGIGTASTSSLSRERLRPQVPLVPSRGWSAPDLPGRETCLPLVAGCRGDVPVGGAPWRTGSPRHDVHSGALDVASCFRDDFSACLAAWCAALSGLAVGPRRTERGSPTAWNRLHEPGNGSLTRWTANRRLW